MIFEDDPGTVPRTVQDLAGVTARNPYTVAAVAVTVTALAVVKGFELRKPSRRLLKSIGARARRKIAEMTAEDPSDLQPSIAAAAAPVVRAFPGDD